VRSLIILAITATSAYAEDVTIHPEELYLGELASLQDTAELQVTVQPSRGRDSWAGKTAIEYGITRRLQVSLEGSWLEGTERELEFGALVAPIRADHIAVVAGGEVGIEGEITPLVAVLVGGRRWGSNLTLAASMESEIEPSAGLAVFGRLSRFTPMAEIEIGEQRAYRAGVAAQFGEFEISCAGGYEAMAGPSVHVSLTWEVGLAGEDDD
jgi:hypothetical protein